MGTLEEFELCTNIEEYFDFFDLAYDERLVYVKRFHILKKYGEMIHQAKKNGLEKVKLLNFYQFALISVYKNFENGYSPSAADVWEMYDKPSACSVCSTSTQCSDIEEVSDGIHACTSQTDIIFN